MITLPGREGKYRTEHFPKRFAADCTAADEEKTDLGRKLGPVMPLIAMFMTGTQIVSTFVWAPVAGLVCAVAAVATGLPVYYMWEKQNRKAA